MIGLRLTTVGISSSFVSLHTNFIMIIGPMATHTSYLLPASTSFWISFVTTPLLPYEPSSVVIYRLPATFFILSSRMMSDLFLPPTMTSASMPCSWSHFTCGYTGAVPTPPATKRIFFFLSSSISSLQNSDGQPSGPTKSANESPAFLFFIISVAAPTTWNTIVMVPSSLE